MRGKKLCPRCKTGKETFELDKRSSECPYLGMNNGRQCAMFVKLNEPKKASVLRRLLMNGKFYPLRKN